MKQLSFLQQCTEPSKPVTVRGSSWKLFVDGASRKNPGLAGAGMALFKDDEPIKKRGWYLKLKTNNQAEYLALLLGLFYSRKLIEPQDILYIMADSELLIKQMSGVYKVKNDEIKKLHQCALHLIGDMRHSFCHVRREYNAIADEMANEGIDKKHLPSQEFIAMLEKYEISF